MSQQQPKKSGLLAMAIAGVLVLAAVVIPGCKKNSEDSSSQNTVMNGNNRETQPLTIERRQEMRPYSPADVKPGATLQEIAAAARTWAPELQHWYGEDAPDFALTDLQGKQHRLSDYKGRNVLVVFWATWCPPCKTEIPELNKLHKRTSPDYLKILAVTNEDKQMVRKFASDYGISYTVLFDEGTLPSFYQMVQYNGIPSAAFINPEGKIKFATVGLIPLEDTRAIIQAAK
jgi:peroxiredoxin